jgi:rhomboid protease GluP
MPLPLPPTSPHPPPSSGASAPTETFAAEFRTAWRSTSGALGLGLAGFAAALGLLVVLLAQWNDAEAGGHAGRVRAFLAIGAVLVAIVAGFLLRQVTGRGPWLRFGADGISGRAVGGHVIAWDRVSDIQWQAVSGVPQLVVQPAAQNAIGRRQQSRRVLPLSPLRRSDREQIHAAAVAAFGHWGGPQARATAQAHADQIDAEIAYEQQLQELTPRIWAMPMVVMACAGAWAAQVALGVDPVHPGIADLLRWGGNALPAVQAGEWWRLLAAMFLHGGILHLALNMFALWEAGRQLTRLFGNLGFLIVYVGAGLAGGALSLHFAARTGVSVGASGAVFGVVGALIAATLRHRDSLPAGRARQMLASLGIFVAVSLGYGLANTGIDNAAHVGGLFAGAIAGSLLVRKADARSRWRILRGRLLAAAACAVMVTALGIAAGPARQDAGQQLRQVRQLRDAREQAALQSLMALQPRIGEALTAMQSDVREFRRRHPGGTVPRAQDQAFSERMRQAHRPVLQALDTELAALNLDAGEPVGAFAAAQRRYLQAQLDLLGDPRRGAPYRITEAEQRARAAAVDSALKALVQSRHALERWAQGREAVTE